MILTQHGMNSILREKGPSYGSVVIGDKTYRTVIIGNQEWIVENLDWAWDGIIIGDNPDPYAVEYEQAYYYNNDETTYGWNGNQCGLLYNWYAIKYLDENADMMLPEGWRVPSEADWKVLISFVGGVNEISKLNSKSSLWYNPGVDEYGFSGLPGGTKTGDGFEGFRSYGEYLSKSLSGPTLTDCACVIFYSSGAGWHSRSKYRPCSVRLVRDYPPPVTIGGRSYKTVKMPDGKVWLAENLDWKFDGLTFRDGTAGNEMTTDASIPQAAYYNYDESTYGAEGKKYGLLYNWTAADYINNHWMGLGLPEGWHVATFSDYRELCNSIGLENGCTKIKTTHDWKWNGVDKNGTDDYGFSLVPNGVGEPGNGFWNSGSTAQLWTSTKWTSTSYWLFDISADMIDLPNGCSCGNPPERFQGIRLVYTPPTKLDLPDRTIRLKMVDNTVDPTTWTYSGVDYSQFLSWSRVDGTDDTWDCLISPNRIADIAYMFREKTDILEVLGANLAGCRRADNLFEKCTNLIYAKDIKANDLDNLSLFSGCTSLFSVHNISATNATSLSVLFNDCKSLRKFDISCLNVDMSKITSLSSTFDGCENLEHVSYMNTCNVTNFTNIFSGCKKLASIPALDTSKATTMDSAFARCPLSSLPNLDTHNVTDMSGMFYGCESLTIAPNLDTTNVLDMSYMLGGCVSLVTVPLYNTSNVTNMSGMFSGDRMLTTIPLFDTSKVINMSEMFYGCTNLTSIPEGFDTSNVTNMFRMFLSCSRLTSLPTLDTRKVTNMAAMLASTALTEIPLFNTANVTNMDSMCSWNSSLTSIPLFDTSSVTDVRQMFQYCPNVETGALALYQQMSRQTTPPTQYSDCFVCGYNTTTGTEERSQIPTDWGGTMSA